MSLNENEKKNELFYFIYLIHKDHVKHELIYDKKTLLVFRNNIWCWYRLTAILIYQNISFHKIFFFIFSSFIWSSDRVTWQRSVHRRAEIAAERFVFILTACSRPCWRRSTFFFSLNSFVWYLENCIKCNYSFYWMFNWNNECFY
jgi:hypothetical protein